MAASRMRIWAAFGCLTIGLVQQTDVAQGQNQVSVGCFGSAGACLDHRLMCSNTSRVAIEKALYGHKTEERCTPGVISCADPCCKYLPAYDCFHSFTADHVGEIYRNCTDHQCHFRTPRLVQDCSLSSVSFQAVSSYSVVEYECVDDSTIIPMCSDIYTVAGTSVSTLYDPKKQYMLQTDTCWCTVYHPYSDPVNYEGIDVRLTSTSGCGILNIYNTTSLRTIRQDCNSPPLWPSMELMRTTDSYTPLKLSGLAEFVWIRLSSTQTMHITCSLNNQHTTTTTSTTTTSTTTTTTVTYPTASPPDVITSTRSTGKATIPTASPSPSSVVSEATVPPTSTGSNTGSTSVKTKPDGSTDKQNGGSRGASTDNTVAAAVGGAAAGVVLLIIIVVLVVWCRSKHSNTKLDRGRESAIYKDPASQSSTNPAFSNGTYDNVKVPQEKIEITPGTKIPAGKSVEPPVVTTSGVDLPPKSDAQTPQYDKLTVNGTEHHDDLKQTVKTDDVKVEVSDTTTKTHGSPVLLRL